MDTEHRWSPVTIETMLQCYYLAEPRKQLGKLSPAQRDAILLLSHHQLIVGADYEPTDKGRAYVELVCRTPVPVEQTSWADPRTGESIS